MNKLLKKQQELQQLYNYSPPTMVGDACHNIKSMAFFLNQEVVELMEEMAGTRDINKPWKSGYDQLYVKPVVITDKVRSEAIDVLKFALNICLEAGITPENIEYEFNLVHERNLSRIADGY